MSTKSIVALRDQNALPLALCERWKSIVGADVLLATKNFREPSFRESLAESDARALLLIPTLIAVAAVSWFLSGNPNILANMSIDQSNLFGAQVASGLVLFTFLGAIATMIVALFAGRLSRAHEYREEFINKPERQGKLNEFARRLGDLAKFFQVPVEALSNFGDEQLAESAKERFVAACVHDRKIEARQMHLGDGLLDDDRKESRQFLKDLYGALKGFDLEISYEEGFRLADERIASEKTAA